MSTPGYTPEFAEVLQAWEQHPPLQPQFVFDLPPDDPRRADKVGVLMYQAVLLRQDHPDLDFSRIKAVTFTADVHRTGDELERAAGQALPHFRSAAARLDVFHVNLGAGQVLIITDEVANATLSPQLPVRLAAWELLRAELARSVAVARLADAGYAAVVPGLPPRRWQALARSAWCEWFCGFHSAVEGLATDMARRRLREALEQDPAAVLQALDQFRRDGDMLELAIRAEGCARGLGEAMAEVHGQLAARGETLARLDPPLHSLVRAQGLASLWDALGEQLARLGRAPAQWTAAPWAGVVSPVLGWLDAMGLHYGAGGELESASAVSGRKTP